MKTLARILLLSLAALVAASPNVFAQRQLGKKKGPTSKLYVAEAVGDTQIQTGERIHTARQATAFDAPGTVIETKADSHNAFVYSNGTGMFIDENSRVEIDRFSQEPFNPRQNANVNASLEPSISQSDVFVSRGAVGICTSTLMSGSSMNYSTPQAAVNIRGGKVSIETTANETIVDLLEGDVTVRAGDKDIGGQILRPGERAIIHTSSSGQPPRISIAPIPREILPTLDERTSVACNAKKTVTFEVIEKKAEQGFDAPSAETAPGNATNSEAAGTDAAGNETPQEIVAKPTVPEDQPVNIVISPDRLPGS